MMNLALFVVIILISLPGVFLCVQSTVKSIYPTLQTRFPNKKPPSERQFQFIAFVQTLILVMIAAAFGAFMHTRLLLPMPLWAAVIQQKNIYVALQSVFISGLLTGIAGAILFLCCYYFIFVPQLDAKTIACMSDLRKNMGFFGRIFYGGIVEEVICRFGLMTFFIWLGSFIFGLTALVYWIAIVLSSLLFALGHLPAYLKFGCQKSAAFFSLVIVLNTGAGCLFGWLFWQYGLAAAIIAHMLFHITWYPFDMRVGK